MLASDSAFLSETVERWGLQLFRMSYYFDAVDGIDPRGITDQLVESVSENLRDPKPMFIPLYPSIFCDSVEGDESVNVRLLLEQDP